MIDTQAADILVWILSHALWLFAIGAAFAVGAACWPGRYRGREVRNLRNEAAEVRLDAAQARAERAAYLARAERERNRADAANARAAAAVEDVVALQHQLRRVLDRVSLAELEAATDWEVEKP